MMAEINNLGEALAKKFGGQVRVIPYNIFYDDEEEVNHLAERVVWDAIPLPAVFIGDEPELSGRIDEGVVVAGLMSRGLVQV